MVARGEYDDGFVNPLITAENFPLPDPTEKAPNHIPQLLSYSRIVTVKEVTEGCKAYGLYPAGVRSLLLLGVHYRSSQRLGPVVALDAVHSDEEGVARVPFVGNFILNGEKRWVLGLLPRDALWRSGTAFLMVSKEFKKAGM
jgi:hypothetical protein